VKFVLILCAKISTENQLTSSQNQCCRYVLSITIDHITIHDIIADRGYLLYRLFYMPTANNINMTDAAATESSSPPAPPPPELPQPQPPTGNDGEVLHLIKPDNVKSR